MSKPFTPGQRVRNIKTDELATVVALRDEDISADLRREGDHDTVAVRYDNDDTIWNTPARKLEPVEEDR